MAAQVILTLARMGFGHWTVVDEDDLLPHNLARHALHGGYFGEAKAIGMAHLLNQIYPDAAIAIVADALAPGDQADALHKACGEAELILDISASAPFARQLAIDVASAARRVSVFLNPQGTDVVVLAEDQERQWTLNSVNPGAALSGGTKTAGLYGVGSDFEKQLVAMTPLGRVGTPKDIAKVVAFLASDDSDWLTGEVILASGGLR